MASSSGPGEETPLARSAREIVRVALITLYRVPPADAARLESELLVWFERLRRRPGSAPTLQGLRSQLVSMACQVAHMYWMGQVEQSRLSDERVERTLSLGPRVVAMELESRLVKPGSEEKTES